MHNLQTRFSQWQIFVLCLNVGKEGKMQSTSKFLIGKPSSAWKICKGFWEMGMNGKREENKDVCDFHIFSSAMIWMIDRNQTCFFESKLNYGY